MNNTITEENLILFIYGEADESLEAQVKSALMTDTFLREKHLALIATMRQIEPFPYQPDDTSVKIILEESALSHREEIY